MYFLAPFYLNDWSNGDILTLQRAFDLDKDVFNDVEILLASYKAESDSGYAFVLYMQNGLLYEVNASHDSNADLEGQWDPEQTSIEILQHRLDKGNLGNAKASQNVFDNQLREVLKYLTVH